MAIARAFGYDGDMPKEQKENRTVRVQPKLWQAALARADERGESLSEAIRRFLERYVR
jgi:predicted HicB family RNase H-like nuclease